MHFGWPQTQLVRIVIAGRNYPAEDVAQLRFIIDKSQQRLATRAPLADAENVLRGRIQADDEQVLVEQNDARAQAVEYVRGFSVDGPVVVGSRRAGVLAVAYGMTTVFCCT